MDDITEAALKVVLETNNSIEAIFKLRRVNKYCRKIADERLKYIKSSKEVSSQWAYEISLHTFVIEGRWKHFPEMFICFYYFDPEYVTKYIKNSKDVLVRDAAKTSRIGGMSALLKDKYDDNTGDIWSAQGPTARLLNHLSKLFT